MDIRLIDESHTQDINLANEPFLLRGKMKIRYDETGWHHEEIDFPPEQITEMTFPDENYQYEEMKKDTIFLGAYEEQTCVGLAILTPGFGSCCYIADLKVKRALRGKGIGKQLIQAAYQYAIGAGYKGLTVIAQDNNLDACRFYLACGFEIGGLDTKTYEHTKQAGKADITFYKFITE